MNDDVDVVVLCECHSLDHIFRLTWMKEYKGSPDELYLDVHLSQYRSFWSRLWYGLKYAFGYKCRYGSCDSVLITQPDAARMVEVLQAYLGDTKGASDE